MVRGYKDVWNEPDEEVIQHEYLDVDRHDHGRKLWALANIFEVMKPGKDSRYREFHLAIVDQYGTERERALRRLDEVRAEAERKGYPGLLARTEWVTGLIRSKQFRLGESQRHYRRSVSLYESVG